MALYFSNNVGNGIRAWVSLVYGYSGAACGPFAPNHRKAGWFRVDANQVTRVWNVDLLTVDPVGAFFAEQYAGVYYSWGKLGVNNEVLIRRNFGFNQCFDDLTDCDQRAEFGVLAFNTASNMLIVLNSQESQEGEDPPIPWEVSVFD